MKSIKVLLYLSLVLLLPGLAVGQVSVGNNGELSGLVFGDYFWMASHHDSTVEGSNGFQFRRVYLTYDHDITDTFSSRLRLEMNSDGNFNSSSSMTPDVKDAYLQWESGSHQIKAGISPSPLFSLIEDVWGYRSVEKSPQDLYGFGSSRDFGLSFKGTLNEGEKLNYHFFFGNGNGNESELDRGKKIMLSLSYNISEQLVVEGYGDWNDTGSGDILTAQGFAGYRSDQLNIGALYAYQYRQNANFDDGLHLDLVSLFSNMRLWDNGKGFIRVDHLYDPNPAGGSITYLPMNPNAESTFLIGGVDVEINSNVNIIPNIEAIIYGETMFLENPSPDIMPRLTLNYEF